jgi:hypothetical protein
MRSFKDLNIDDLLAAVRSSSERVRVCADEVMDDIIISTHQTVNNNRKVSNDIHTITRQAREEVGQLRGKIDEILKQQKSFQTALDAVSCKNSLLSFLIEYLSKLNPLSFLALGYTHLPEKNQSSLRKTSRQRSLHPSTSQVHL